MAQEPQAGEMKRSLTLTGITVNAMALIAPGAFLWTTFASQSALNAGTKSTAGEMWTGLVFSLILALLTAYSYAQLAKIYPDAGAGSSYYFAESAFLDKESPKHRGYARFAKLSVGWISHLYYWIYPGIMVAFTATLFGYIYLTVAHHQLSFCPLAAVAVVFAVHLRLHRLPGRERLDHGGDRRQRDPDHHAGDRQRHLHRLAAGPRPRRTARLPVCKGPTSTPTPSTSSSPTASSTCCTSRPSPSCCWSASSR